LSLLCYDYHVTANSLVYLIVEITVLDTSALEYGNNMPHADAAFVPSGISKTEFWAHVHSQLASLLEGQRNWVTNLANASSLIYSSLLACEAHFGAGNRAVNWCVEPAPSQSSRLLLGPFCGKPACQLINVAPGKARGVCADAYLQRKTLLVPDVDAYPGHIACDGETKSEIVCPLILRHDGEETAIGVLDLDCLALSGFSEEDRAGLERIALLVVDACDW
ncbi:Free methionine-R-sulfoxide reductase, partial [Grifola frondosa]